MKIQKVKFQNFRNVPDMERELNGANIILLAENTKGKSNFIKGLTGALTGKIGLHAIKDGEDESKVEVVLSDFNDKGEAIPGTDYTFKIKIRKDKEGEEKAILEVYAPNGFKEVKKTVIGSIVGEIELDYDFVALSKTKAGKARQLEIIKSYLDAETLQVLDLEQNKIKSAYDERTEIGRLKTSAEGFIKESKLTKEDFDTYKTKKDVGELKKKRDAQREEKDKRFGKISEMNSKLTALDERKPTAEKELEEARAKVKALEAEIEDIATKKELGQKWLKENPEIDITSIESEYDSVIEFNSNVEKVEAVIKKQKELTANEEHYGELTALIDSSRQCISDTLRQMDFPIEGISFDEENVYFNGKLIDESTMSTSEIMMLEVELKMSRTPNAAVVFIQRGESLGTQMLSQLQKVAKERGYQLIMEQVERGTEELKIELMPNY
jgi:hypothetical protein